MSVCHEKKRILAAKTTLVVQDTNVSFSKNLHEKEKNHVKAIPCVSLIDYLTIIRRRRGDYHNQSALRIVSIITYVIILINIIVYFEISIVETID